MNTHARVFTIFYWEHAQTQLCASFSLSSNAARMLSGASYLVTWLQLGQAASCNTYTHQHL